MITVSAEEFDAGRYPHCTTSRLEIIASRSPDGNPISIPVIVLTGQRRHPRVALVAGVHGDEYEGPRALVELSEALEPEGLAGTLVIVPVAHRAAFGAGTRVSPIDGLDLARSFPGDSSGSLTERLAHCLFHRVLAGADHIADLHSAGSKYLHLPLAGFYDTPGAVGKASRAAAQSWGFEYIWSVPHRSGVLSYEAVRNGIPATGGEVGGQGGCLRQDIDSYKSAMRNLLEHLGLIKKNRPRTAAVRPQVLNGDWMRAPCSGILLNHATLGQSIKKGELLLTLYDLYGSPLDHLSAPSDGIVAGLRTFSTIHEGESVISLLS